MSSSTPKSTTQVVYNQSEPPDWVSTYMPTIASASQYYYSNDTGPRYYPAQTYVDFDWRTSEALQKAEQTARGTNPLVPGAIDFASGLMGSRGVSSGAAPYANVMSGIATGANKLTTEGDYRGLFDAAPSTPYAQQYLTPYARGDYLASGNPYFEARLQDQLTKTADQVNSYMSAKGRYGSGAHTGTLADSLGRTRTAALADDFSRNQAMQFQAAQAMDSASNANLANRANILQGLTSVQGANITNQGNTAQSAANLYQAAQSEALRTALASPALAETRYNDLARLADVGTQYENQQARILQDAIARYEFDQMRPWNQLALFSGAVQGTNTGLSTTQTTQKPGLSTGQKILGGSALGAGVGSSIYGTTGGLLGALGGGLLGLL